MQASEVVRALAGDGELIILPGDGHLMAKSGLILWERLGEWLPGARRRPSRLERCRMIRARPATDDDLGAIARVAIAGDERGVDSASRASYCGFLLDHGQLIVGEQEDCVVAYAGSIPLGPGWLLTDAPVHPDHRSEGAGKAVVEAALAGAADRCTFSSQDPRALHRYAACGMRPHWPLLMLRGEPAKVGHDPRRR